MNRCPITYEDCVDGMNYSIAGLKKLSPRLSQLKLFPYDIREQEQEAKKRISKISVQGVQPKLSAKLNIAKACFELVDSNASYILKPQNNLYSELPQNEAVTMSLAAIVGILVPIHGLIYCKDNSLTYFIKRFDRGVKKKKYQVEDFAQLAGLNRDNKYNYSMEKLIPLLEYCSFPMLGKAELFKRTVFYFLTGNEDMHLKNFSLITKNGKSELAPAYDFLNTALALRMSGVAEQDIEEFALPIAGKKRKIDKKILIDYYAKERLGLNGNTIARTLQLFEQCYDQWFTIIDRCFLSEQAKILYKELLKSRFKRLLG